ncbi:DUF2807 domain-containing protein [Cellulophaga baltica]|uniref:head GIN domain-containing protein n=1 Tax=Cellulophaga TaxID=104264 RepID=UPI001C075E54|nr:MULTISPECIES: head GIN domain-containing protein [Cellulophaga]MBU2995895.1 DUF2807 domain-containing protein [Cellulophaga baltica]MDO6767290.1 head GIN domain-containing protein [Cellulophaga sp. 1_MG-2023]
MKQFYISIFLIISLVTNIQGQEEEDILIPLDKFTSIKAFDGISINLIKSDINKAIIKGENTKKVAIVEKDGLLKIRMEITKMFSGYKTFVDLYYTDELITIDVNEDAKITNQEVITQKLLELKAQEGGELVISTQVDQLLIKTVTGGIITTTGFSKNQDVMINTGGVYHGKDFKTYFTTVNVNAGSSAEIYAVDYAKVSVKAGGEVQVYGNPEKMDEKKVFGGTITRVE